MTVFFWTCRQRAITPAASSSAESVAALAR
jgi:hypothetical protein